MNIFLLTKISTAYGAVIEPTCAHVEQVPRAELRISVGNNSAAYSVTTEYVALIPKRPNIANATTQVVLPGIKLHFKKDKVSVEGGGDAANSKNICFVNKGLNVSSAYDTGQSRTVQQA
uniref:Uncharacterized protein n=1 Tax=Glossina pallidipes TaxID=7398 RepID=A0A1B0AGL6_GLOPL